MGMRQELVRHRAPEWFEDAKLGVFVHWGLFSVPAWAPTGAALPELLREHFWDLQSFSPYAEWYANALRIPDSPTWRHHREKHGDAPYESFREPFENALEGWDPGAWAELFAAAGARYVVLVTKHHDGYCLWPTRVENPRRPGWHAPRDVVSELAAAVRARGMRFGVYYSGGLDWTFEPGPIRGLVDLMACVPGSADYRRHADAQVRELVELVSPSVLWNDIAWPTGGRALWSLLHDYLEAVPDGAINDRFLPVPPWLSGALRVRPLQCLAGVVGEQVLRWRGGGLTPPPTSHADFRTPEYATFPEARPYKWEACRGIAKSFGWNRAEAEGDRIGPDALVREFADLVAKNGNLLLNVGPDDGGRIPPEEASRLEALGAWLRRNGEAIYATRPWRRSEGRTGCGIPVRFTAKEGAVFALLLGTPAGGEVVLEGVETGAEVELLGQGGLTASREGDALRLAWPRGLPEQPAWALRIGTTAAGRRSLQAGGRSL